MLQALEQYAEDVGLKTKPGFRVKSAVWLLTFSLDGRFLGVQDLRGDDRKSKGREFAACPDLTDVELKSVVDGKRRRHFLLDSLGVVTKYGDDGDEDVAAKHGYFVDMLAAAAESVPVLSKLAEALRQGNVLAAINAKLAESRAKATESATLAVLESNGDVDLLVENPAWHAWWQSYRDGLSRRLKAKKAPKVRAKKDSAAAQTAVYRCLLSGELVEPANHYVVSGLADVGGQPSGDRLVSFDKSVFSSYGLKGCANAAMSDEAAKMYSAVLDQLLRRHSYRLAGAKVVHWYSGPVADEDDPLRELVEGFGLGPSEIDTAVDNGAVATPRKAKSASIRERAAAESCVQRLLGAISSGDAEARKLGNYRYYALTLSANSGRVIVRDWMEGRFEDLLRSVDAWFDDLAIINRYGEGVVSSQKFAAVLAAPLRDLKDATAPQAATLWRCALKRLPIPFSMMAQTLHRVRLDVVNGESPRHARYGLLKAFCIRNERTPDMTSELNEFERDPAYLCGRIMAILARIQQRAMPDVNVGVVQRYYAAASATPALVLGRLIRTAKIAHIPKLDSKGLQVWFDNQLADVWAKLEQRPPTALSLEGQTLFAMGYYHQNAKRFDAAKDDSSESNAAESVA
jgi:CRISPR-associated protein Csd1